MTECFILGMYASFQINVKPLLPDVLDYINTCKTVLKLVLGLVLVNSQQFFIFYSTTKHEIIQIKNHNLLCSLDPPNQSRLF